MRSKTHDLYQCNDAMMQCVDTHNAHNAWTPIVFSISDGEHLGFGGHLGFEKSVSFRAVLFRAEIQEEFQAVMLSKSAST